MVRQTIRQRKGLKIKAKTEAKAERMGGFDPFDPGSGDSRGRLGDDRGGDGEVTSFSASKMRMNALLRLSVVSLLIQASVLKTAHTSLPVQS